MDQSEGDSQQGCIEKHLNIDLHTNNKRQDCEMGTVWGDLWRGGWMEEMEVREYGGWTSETYVK
jgi:hypothetical protein